MVPNGNQTTTFIARGGRSRFQMEATLRTVEEAASGSRLLCGEIRSEVPRAHMMETAPCLRFDTNLAAGLAWPGVIATPSDRKNKTKTLCC